ncbi:MAG: radical SAM protein [Deferribacteres bacterium]|nr:radical SAM protein [Deferribacteres bacterium]
MRICLINPPQTLHRRFGAPYVFQPLGLLYVAAVLERRHQVYVLDASVEGWRNLREINGRYYLGLSFDEIRERIRAIKPDLAGITVPFSINEANAVRTASEVKAVDKDIITVLGGVHPSVRPRETLLSGCVDFVIIGEGEETAWELVETLEDGSSCRLKDIAGIGFMKGSRPVLTRRRPLVRDLDSLPFPARHLLPMHEYFSAMRITRGARAMYTFHERWTSVITSRGCPYNCRFCSIHLTMGRKFRARSPENIIAELKLAVADYGIRHINFEDDNLTLDKRRAGRIFDMMADSGLNVSWSAPNGIRADTVDRELAGKMKRSGCKRVFVAPESGSQDVVTRIIGKKLDLRRIEEAVALFREHGIVVDGSFVMGLIGETQSDIWKTITYALSMKRAGMAAAGLHIATPYYGTALYKEARRKGFMEKDPDDSLFSTQEPLIGTPQWSRGELRRLHDIASWLLKNHTFAGLHVYIMILRRFPALWPYLKYSHRIVAGLRHVPRGLRRRFHYWSPLAGNALATVKLKATGRLPEIKYMVYEVTDACNSRCGHCFIWRDRPSGDILTPAETEEMLGDVLFSGLRAVLLTGGEPVLRDDIRELIGAIHRARPAAEITLSTNALLPERVLDVADYAIANNIYINIGISLDAVGDRHDRIRGVRGNFRKADYLLQELAGLKEKYPDRMGVIVIGHTLSNLTVDTLKDVLAYARQSGTGFITQLHEEFDYYRNVGKNGNVRNYRCADNTALIRAVEELPPSFHNEILLGAMRHTLRYRCAALRDFFLLRCNGTVTPCLRYSEAGAGDVRARPFSEIWHSGAAQESRRLVEACPGCSNSWAASWSFESWFPSFWRQGMALAAKNLSARWRNLRV